jgi:hypothetical protein
VCEVYIWKSSNEVRDIYGAEGKHGPLFFRMASKINAAFGPNFVTEKSDEGYVVGDGPEAFILLWERGPGDILYSWAARPSLKQKEYISSKYIENPAEYKLVKSRDVSFQTQRARIGDGWLRRTSPEGIKVLEDLWNSQDVIQQFVKSQPVAA